MWKNLEHQDVPCGTLRCTFVLKPMVADMDGVVNWPDMTKRLNKLITRNLWFSEVSLSTETESRRVGGETKSRKLFGQVMARLFDSTKRSRGCNSYSVLEPSDQEDETHQIETLKMTCHQRLRLVELEAMGSAMVVNQATKNLAMILSFSNDNDTIGTREWWRWIAYSFFSKRARTFSSLESLALVNIRDLSYEDMEYVSSVVNSDHPEEELFRYPRGQVDERDATLQANASIRWESCDDERDETELSHFTFPTPIHRVKTFSDDGRSGWVNVIVPGFGRCQVQRSELESVEDCPSQTNQPRLLSLTLSFAKLEMISFECLPDFLGAIGPVLKSLTLDVPDMTLNEAWILDMCPNLEELTISGAVFDVHLDLSDTHIRDELVEDEQFFDWQNVQALSRDMSDMNNALVRSIRQLRVYPRLSAHTIAAEAKALIRMLRKNRTLDFVEMSTMKEYQGYCSEIREQHLQRIDCSIQLPLENKLAFLSVISPKGERTKKLKHKNPPHSLLSGIDRHVLALIFEFSGSPIWREVYFHWEDEDFDDEEESLHSTLFG